MFGRHGVPGEDVEELVTEVEMTPSRDLLAIDQDYIQFRQPAGRARNAVEGIHHQHQDAELPLHDFNETRGRHFAELEFGHETFARLHSVFKTLMA